MKFTFCDFTDAADACRDVTFPSLRADVGLDAGREPPAPPGWEVREAGRDWTGVGGFSTTDSGLDVPGVVGYIEEEHHWNIFEIYNTLYLYPATKKSTY